jgi:FkbM family methyltransferase
MTLKSRLVRYFDDIAPALMGNARFHLHVSLRGDIVFPGITSQLFRRMASQNCTAIDVGANVGLFTHYLSRYFAQVVAVEPVPYLAARLTRAAPRNCRVIATALGDAEGTITLRIPVNAQGREMPALSTASESNTLSFIDKASCVERIVPVTRLDTIASSANQLAFVKIDVEGFEEAVLQGAPKMLNTQRPVLQMEVGRAHNPGYLRVLALLCDADYCIFALQNDGLHSNALAFIEAQPEKVAHTEESSPPGCWDYICVPQEKLGDLTEGLLKS